MIYCLTCRQPIPPERMKRKGAARFVCQDSHYAALRAILRSSGRKIIIHLPPKAQAQKRSAQTQPYAGVFMGDMGS